LTAVPCRSTSSGRTGTAATEDEETTVVIIVRALAAEPKLLRKLLL
jgi:hypothetical protein